MDQTPLIILAVLVVIVVVVLVLARKFDWLKLTGKHGETEASIEAGRRDSPEPTGGGGVASGAIKVGGSMKDAEASTDVSGSPERGAGSVEVGKDVEGGSISTKVDQRRDGG